MEDKREISLPGSVFPAVRFYILGFAPRSAWIEMP